MSAKYVMDLAKHWAESLTLPFFDTINVEQNPADTMWVTLEFDYATSEELTFCGNQLHIGTFTLVFFGVAGAGYETLLEAAETDGAVFYLNEDPTHKLVMTGIDPPEEFESSGHVPLFGVAISVNYEYIP